MFKVLNGKFQLGPHKLPIDGMSQSAHAFLSAVSSLYTDRGPVMHTNKYTSPSGAFYDLRTEDGKPLLPSFVFSELDKSGFKIDVKAIIISNGYLLSPAKFKDMYPLFFDYRYGKDDAIPTYTNIDAAALQHIQRLELNYYIQKVRTRTINVAEKKASPAKVRKKSARSIKIR